MSSIVNTGGSPGDQFISSVGESRHFVKHLPTDSIQSFELKDKKFTILLDAPYKGTIAYDGPLVRSAYKKLNGAVLELKQKLTGTIDGSKVTFDSDCITTPVKVLFVSVNGSLSGVDISADKTHVLVTGSLGISGTESVPLEAMVQTRVAWVPNAKK